MHAGELDKLRSMMSDHSGVVNRKVGCFNSKQGLPLGLLLKLRDNAARGIFWFLGILLFSWMEFRGGDVELEEAKRGSGMLVDADKLDVGYDSQGLPPWWAAGLHA